MSEHRLDEITIERPRGGMRMSSSRLKGVTKTLDRLTQIAAEEGLLSPYLIKVHDKSKYFSDHLSPLRRFLYRKVGQPWDDVYSELCDRLDITTLSGQHILSHLWHFVERHVEIIDGKPHRKPYDGYHFLFNRRRDRLYIHPDSGLLCLAKGLHKPPQSTDLSQDLVKIDPYHYYRQIDGIWYQITCQDLPPMGHVWDIVLKIDVSRSSGTTIYAARKHQCNKKELKHIADQLALLASDRHK